MKTKANQDDDFSSVKDAYVLVETADNHKNIKTSRSSHGYAICRCYFQWRQLA